MTAFRCAFLSLVLVASGCAMETTQTGARESYVKKVAVASFIKDQLFGSGNKGAAQEVFPLAEVDWNSNEVVASRVTQLLQGAGIEVVSMTYDQNAFARADPKRRDLALSQQIGLELAKGAEAQQIDAFVIAYPLPINMYGNISNPAGYFLAWGPIGLIAERSMSYYPAFLVKINRGMEARLSGKSSCIIGLAVSVIDAHSNQIKAEKLKVFGRDELPHDLWAEQYEAFSGGDKQAIKTTCLGALVKGMNLALADVGLVNQ